MIKEGIIDIYYTKLDCINTQSEVEMLSILACEENQAVMNSLLAAILLKMC
jgi:hypothetical protein